MFAKRKTPDDGMLAVYNLLKTDYAKSRKSTFDAEYYFFRWYRPLSFFPTALLIIRGVSANQVTMVGAIVLLGAFFLLFIGNLRLGALAYLFAYILDFVDGNIARHSGKPTHFGKMIDGLVDSLTFLLFIALALGNIKSGIPIFGESIELWLGVICAFVFLFRAYFHIRMGFVLSNTNDRLSSKIEATPDSRRGPSKIAVRTKCKSLLYGKKLYFGLISGMPIFLNVAAFLNVVSFYLLFYLIVFMLGTLLEVVHGLNKVQSLDRSANNEIYQ